MENIKNDIKLNLKKIEVDSNKQEILENRAKAKTRKKSLREMLRED